MGGENGEVGWKVHLSHTGAGEVRDRSDKLKDWCVQLFLPPTCLGPATLCKTATPPSPTAFLFSC